MPAASPGGAVKERWKQCDISLSTEIEDRIDSMDGVQVSSEQKGVPYLSPPSLQKNLLYTTASVGGDLGSCIEWVEAPRREGDLKNWE